MLICLQVANVTYQKLEWNSSNSVAISLLPSAFKKLFLSLEFGSLLIHRNSLTKPPGSFFVAATGNHQTRGQAGWIPKIRDEHHTLFFYGSLVCEVFPFFNIRYMSSSHPVRDKLTTPLHLWYHGRTHLGWILGVTADGFEGLGVFCWWWQWWRWYTVIIRNTCMRHCEQILGVEDAIARNIFWMMKIL